MSEYNLNKRSEAGVEYVRLMAKGGFLKKNIIKTEETVQQYQQLEEEGKPLPEGIYPMAENGMREYFTVENAVTDMTPGEIDRLIALRQAKDIHTIRNWVIFFGVLAVISVAAGFIIALT